MENGIASQVSVGTTDYAFTPGGKGQDVQRANPSREVEWKMEKG